MFDVVLAKLDRLSGEAVKLALYLAHLAPTRASLEGPDFVTVLATAELVSDASQKISIPQSVVRKALKELVNHEVVEKHGRAIYGWNNRSVSYPGRTFARSSEPQDLDNGSRGDETDEPPPWARSLATEVLAKREEAVREASRKDGRSPALGGERRRDRDGIRMDSSVLSPNADVEQSAREPSTYKLSGSEKVCSSCGEPGAIGCECFEPLVSAHSFVVDCVVRMYEDCYHAKLTVDGKAGSIVKRLLKLHPAAEIVRRARVMFYEPRKWPSPPYHWGSLSAHFDSFVAVTKTVGGMADRDKRKTGANYYGKVDDV